MIFYYFFHSFKQKWERSKYKGIHFKVSGTKKVSSVTISKSMGWNQESGGINYSGQKLAEGAGTYFLLFASRLSPMKFNFLSINQTTEIVTTFHSKAEI